MEVAQHKILSHFKGAHRKGETMYVRSASQRAWTPEYSGY